MPKIDWFDDAEQPRWEPRPRRERLSREQRLRRARLEQLIAITANPPLVEPPGRQPLHLIWGTPVRPRSEGSPN
jgi:hypothetical protein